MKHNRNQRGNQKTPGNKWKEINDPKFMGCNKSGSKGEVYSSISPDLKKQEKFQISNFTPKETRKRKQTKPNITRKKEMIKIRAEKNEKEI